MVVNNNDVVKCFGQYRMKLTPYLVKDKKNNIINGESTAQVTMYDISKKFDLLWSTRLGIQEAHAAMTMFEIMGYFDAPIDVH